MNQERKKASKKTKTFHQRQKILKTMKLPYRPTLKLYQEEMLFLAPVSTGTGRQGL